MTIQIQTNQILTIQILKKVLNLLYIKKFIIFFIILNTYVGLIKIYMPFFYFFKTFNIFKKFKN